LVIDGVPGPGASMRELSPVQFRRALAILAAHWPEIATVDYASKLAISLVFFLPLYGVALGWLQSRVLGPDARVAVARGGAQ
jgi:hypothetical protein